jgi:hypothetical protein
MAGFGALLLPRGGFVSVELAGLPKNPQADWVYAVFINAILVHSTP